MVKEGELQCCVYHHLRNYLQRDKRWSVFAERYSRHTKHQIDILVFQERWKREVPRVAIELKWNRNIISKKDRQSLDRALRRNRFGLDMGYFITTLIGEGELRRVKKKPEEKYNFNEIAILLDKTGDELKKWKAKLERFKTEMGLGRRALHK